MQPSRLPGAGDRLPLSGAEQARADLMRAISAGEHPSDHIIDRLVVPLVELFDAFASGEKTRYANMGGHTGLPAFAGEGAVGILRGWPT